MVLVTLRRRKREGFDTSGKMARMMVRLITIDYDCDTDLALGRITSKVELGNSANGLVTVELEKERGEESNGRVLNDRNKVRRR